jgi:23S rRNA (adenine2503-C2)-methyltransferase
MEFPQVNLAVSLHSADNDLRNKLVPINKTYPLPDLLAALERYINLTNKKIFLEYTLLAGVNDREKDAEKLTELIYSTDYPKLFHVNLIAYNSTDTGFKKPSIERISSFKAHLVRHKIFVTLRKSLGEEILGACGQLAGEKR